ncbi:hypothetical protein NUU61_003884 [Penicillium alfredii]|uniref:Uncharacterized protein n=1 Tax=Penicillium alfredii TaxID=1506179 RepID=A0A9W9FKM0_9EURO|nr:uncharacterized protein NUU61_003884 [Penicillium alfredii]KAJ5101662.1 hypothetical protein NUU61_003884 [Penicillium alfredii]
MALLFSRFFVLCAVVACTIFSFTWLWLLSSQEFGEIVPLTPERFQTPNPFKQRLVVFGDSWSDNDTENLPGKVWTDWLCSMMDCRQDNLAQTTPSRPQGKYTGCVVDKTELELWDQLSQTRLADFKTQLRDWLDAESQATKGLSTAAIRRLQDHTVFVVAFEVWDIWSLATKDPEQAAPSVERRIKTLLSQLDLLSARWGAAELKVILTQAIDVTFLPAFGYTGARNKDTVRIVGLWNRRLRQAVRAWDRGSIYLFDTNTFLMDRIRDWQLYAAGIEEDNGLGKNTDPGWENVVDPCVESGDEVMMNEIHLGPSAHRLLATEIHRGVEEILLSPKLSPPSDERHSRRGSAA